MKNIFLLRIVGLSLTLHLSLSDTAHALRGVEISEQQSNSLKEELSPVSAAGLEEGSDPTWNEESVALLGNELKKYARSHGDPDPNAFMAEYLGPVFIKLAQSKKFDPLHPQAGTYVTTSIDWIVRDKRRRDRRRKEKFMLGLGSLNWTTQARDDNRDNDGATVASLLDEYGANLTREERELVQEVADGAPLSQIAGERRLPYAAVKRHYTRIIRRLRLSITRQGRTFYLNDILGRYPGDWMLIRWAKERPVTNVFERWEILGNILEHSIQREGYDRVFLINSSIQKAPLDLPVLSIYVDNPIYWQKREWQEILDGNFSQEMTEGKVDVVESIEKADIVVSRAGRKIQGKVVLAVDGTTVKGVTLSLLNYLEEQDLFRFGSVFVVKRLVEWTSEEGDGQACLVLVQSA